jgi:hypothetical protein
MSLRTIHLLFIIASILLAFGTGYWAVEQVREGVSEHTALAVVTNLSGLALVGYGIWFVRKKFSLLGDA